MRSFLERFLWNFDSKIWWKFWRSKNNLVPLSKLRTAVLAYFSKIPESFLVLVFTSTPQKIISLLNNTKRLYSYEWNSFSLCDRFKMVWGKRRTRWRIAWILELTLYINLMDEKENTKKVIRNFIERVIGAFFHPTIEFLQLKMKILIVFCPFYQFTW